MERLQQLKKFLLENDLLWFFIKFLIAFTILGIILHIISIDLKT